MSGHGGKRQGAGRKKGVPNKLTAHVKDAVQSAFLEMGGENYLVKVATSYRSSSLRWAFANVL